MKNNIGRISVIMTLISICIMSSNTTLISRELKVLVNQELARSRIELAWVTLRSFEIPLMEYNVDNDTYPTTAQGLKILLEKGYIKKIRLDPWGFPINYRYPGKTNPKTYEIWTNGADGMPGGDGEAADIMFTPND